jgi:hypothetical protein
VGWVILYAYPRGFLITDELLIDEARFLEKSYLARFLRQCVVFIVALPLSLGIAMASRAPLFSGIIAGILGGIVVGLD